MLRSGWLLVLVQVFDVALWMAAAKETTAEEPREENEEIGALRPDQLARLGVESEADMDDGVAGEEVAGGAGLVVDRADHDHVGGASQAGALAGNQAAAAAVRARLTGTCIPNSTRNIERRHMSMASSVRSEIDLCSQWQLLLLHRSVSI